MNLPRKIETQWTPEKMQHELRKAGRDVTPEQAEGILLFFTKLADTTFRDEKGVPLYPSEYRRAS